MWGYGGSGGYSGFEDEGAGPWGSAAISQRAEAKLEEAKTLFDNHIALVDVSAGPVRRAARGGAGGCWAQRWALGGGAGC